MSGWDELRAMDGERLGDARLQLHWAVQIVSSAGRTLLEPRPDDSHPNLTWMGGGWMAGNPVGERAVRAGLETETLALQLLQTSGASRGRLALDGHTLEDGYGWLEQSLASALGTPVALSRERYDIPTHGVGGGAPFRRSDPQGLTMLRRWFGNADWALRSVTDGRAGASDIRIWPHHFDIGGLLAIDDDVETGRSIGIGMTPGDDSYTDPYYYVNPYPRPDPSDLPEWPGPGHWHTEGWVGLVLTSDDILNAGDASWQQAVAIGFLEGALTTLRRWFEP